MLNNQYTQYNYKGLAGCEQILISTQIPLKHTAFVLNDQRMYHLIIHVMLETSYLMRTE